MSARENILARIRSANAARVPDAIDASKVSSRLAEHPRGPMPKMDWDPRQRFISCSLALASTVAEVKTLEDVPQAVAGYLAENNLPKAGVCWPELGDLDWGGAGLQMQAREATGDDQLGVTG
ncbi:MAG: lactate utilization protein C, partial [Burkholderiales bacterium]